MAREDLPPRNKSKGAHLLNKLTALAIKNATKSGLYADGGGLCLQVARGGSKTWVFRYARNGREHKLGLGSLNAVTLAEARDNAREARNRLANGIDPISAKREGRAQAVQAEARKKTFAWCAEQFIAEKEADPEGAWGHPKNAKQWRGSLKNYVLPTIGNLSVDDIDGIHVLNVLQPIWSDMTVTASRVQGTYRVHPRLGEISWL